MMSRAWLVFGLLAGCFSNAPQVGQTASDGSSTGSGGSGSSSGGTGTGDSSTGTTAASSDEGTADGSTGGPTPPQVGTIYMKAVVNAQSKSTWLAAFGGPPEGCELTGGAGECATFSCGPMPPMVPDAGPIEYAINGSWQPAPLTPDSGGHYPVETLETLPFSEGDMMVGFRAPGNGVPEFMVQLSPPPALTVQQAGNEIHTGAPMGFSLTWTAGASGDTAVLRLRQQGVMLYCSVPAESGALTVTPPSYADLGSGEVAYELTIEHDAPVTAGGWNVTATLALAAQSSDNTPVAGTFMLP
ncbi:MAG: hypothetical protein K1X88_06030 [Nannocystaceae bacterium]|nr:hypothetical protein [Nannocystaceae bacterium]